MVWPAFPKRLQSALKALCCLAQSGDALQSQKIAERIRVPRAETAKVLQLLVWGGFVTSRRGTKGGFHLAASADRITMGEVIGFFLSRHTQERDDDFAVMRVFQKISAPCQKAFSSLTLEEIATKRTSPGYKRSAEKTGAK